MDGRTQLPVINYLKEHFGVEYVDSITEAGPNKILAEGVNKTAIDAILARLSISVNKHHSVGIAVVGHHDCAGNPAEKKQQMIDTQKAVSFLCTQHSGAEIVGLWVDSNWQVCEVDC